MFQLWPWKVLDQAGQPRGMRTALARLTRLANMHNENPDCMFFLELRRIIVRPHGFSAGAAGYVREAGGK